MGRVLRLGQIHSGLLGLPLIVMLCLGGFICLIALIGIDYLVDILSAPKQ